MRKHKETTFALKIKFRIKVLGLRQMCYSIQYKDRPAGKEELKNYKLDGFQEMRFIIEHN